MPIRMIYEPTSTEKGIEVDVYHFHQLDETLEDAMRITVIAAGFNKDNKPVEEAQEAATEASAENGEEDFGVLVDLFTKKK